MTDYHLHLKRMKFLDSLSAGFLEFLAELSDECDKNGVDIIYLLEQLKRISSQV